MKDASPSQTIHLALLGYGRMGRAIAEIAPARGFEILRTFTSASTVESPSIAAASLRDVDVCLEFTHPDAVMENIRRVAPHGCNLVVGTTGWYAHMEEVRHIVERNGIGLVYGANFSLGIQLFYKLAGKAARLFQHLPQYEPYILEAHHSKKKDAPSGTALELQRQIEPLLRERTIAVNSVRAGYIPGTHELGFDSESETMLLRHVVRSRRTFAEGALVAARWVMVRKGLFHFSQILETEEET